MHTEHLTDRWLMTQPDQLLCQKLQPKPTCLPPAPLFFFFFGCCNLPHMMGRRSQAPMSGAVPPLLLPLTTSSVCVCLCEPAISYLTVKQQVQLPVDPLLDIQPPLQVLTIVFDCQLAQLAVRWLLCFVRRLEHHPGLGARVWRHSCHGLGRTVETHRFLSPPHTHTDRPTGSDTFVFAIPWSISISALPVGCCSHVYLLLSRWVFVLSLSVTPALVLCLSSLSLSL